MVLGRTSLKTRRPTRSSVDRDRPSVGHPPEREPLRDILSLALVYLSAGCEAIGAERGLALSGLAFDSDRIDGGVRGDLGTAK